MTERGSFIDWGSPNLSNARREGRVTPRGKRKVKVSEEVEESGEEKRGPGRPAGMYLVITCKNLRTSACPNLGTERGGVSGTSAGTGGLKHPPARVPADEAKKYIKRGIARPALDEEVEAAKADHDYIASEDDLD